jgi:hypothetical protein
MLREEHRLRVFEKRVPRRIFVTERDEVTGGWRELHNEELRNLHPSLNIIRSIKSRTEMGGPCSMHGSWEMRTKCRLKSLNIRDHSEDLSVDVKILLKLIFRKYGSEV